MVLETLGWGKEAREDISFVLEARLLYTQPTDVNWRNLFAVKMSPTNALLVTLGQNTITPSIKLLKEEMPKFSKETGCREAALILLKEKGMRYSPVREPLMLDKCVICWEQDWDDCFEVTEFTTKESYIFKVLDKKPVTNTFREPTLKSFQGFKEMVWFSIKTPNHILNIYQNYMVLACLPSGSVQFWCLPKKVRVVTLRNWKFDDVIYCMIYQKAIFTI